MVGGASDGDVHHNLLLLFRDRAGYRVDLREVRRIGPCQKQFTWFVGRLTLRRMSLLEAKDRRTNS